MARHHRKYHRVSYFASSFAVVLGLVLIWRGIWHFLDFIDLELFAGNSEVTSLVGIVLGFAVLYLPDHNLDEIRKL
jgi:di/tricarboxylate transporter